MAASEQLGTDIVRVASHAVLVVQQDGICTLRAGGAFAELTAPELTYYERNQVLGPVELAVLAVLARLPSGASNVEAAPEFAGGRLGASASTVADAVARLLDLGLLDRGVPDRGVNDLGLVDRREHGAGESPLTPPRHAADAGVAEAEFLHDDIFEAITPITCNVTGAGFTFYDRRGHVSLGIGADEAIVLSAIVIAAPFHEVLARGDGLGMGLGSDGVRRILHRLVDHGLASRVTPGAARVRPFGTSAAVGATRRDGMVRLLDSLDQSAKARPSRGRPAVVPIVAGFGTIPPASLGLIMANAMAWEGGRLTELYDFEPRWVPRRRELRRLLQERGPAVLLFSNYAWTMQENLVLSAYVKEIEPDCITVHGGPNTPSYLADAEAFLRSHPHVDVIARGEGEITAAELLGAIDGKLGSRDDAVARLSDVAGISFLLHGDVIRTPDRPRVTDLNTLPSPYLTGLFDDYHGAAPGLTILETNRGCPYGCTFCDWGSATLSRLRMFDLDRVFAEIEWLGTSKVNSVILGDSNFGMVPRDVSIAEKVAEVRQRFGYPREFFASTAKNKVKHLKHIVTILNDGGVYTEAVLALQTTDAVVLDTINRANIRTEAYHTLALEYQKAGLAVSTEYIIGLPGSTVDSVAGDLQGATDREIHVRANPLELLVNSPMNEPAYRDRFAVQSAAMPRDPNRQLVVSSSSHSRADLDAMWELSRFFFFAENSGRLRYLARWMRQTTGIVEIDLYRSMMAAASGRPRHFPLLLWAQEHVGIVGVPPLSWSHYYGEVVRFLVDELGVSDGSEVRTLEAVHLLLTPDRDRSFPESIELAPDVATWFSGIRAAKEVDPLTWAVTAPPLGAFGPARFTVDDPDATSAKVVGRGTLYDMEKLTGELSSPLARDLARRTHVPVGS